MTDIDSILKGLHEAKFLIEDGVKFWKGRGLLSLNAIDGATSELKKVQQQKTEEQREREELECDVEVEGGGSTWWYVCGECHTAVDSKDRYCRQCGAKLKWR